MCTVDSKTLDKKEVPIPEISMTDEIADMTLGRNFYGRIHSFVLTRS